jgi:putative transposase
MTPPAPTARYKNHRFPGEIISYGVWLYYRFPLSYRDVQELLCERGIDVTVTRAQRIRHIPPDTHQNDLCKEMRRLETDRHRRSPSCITVGRREKSYRKAA